MRQRWKIVSAITLQRQAGLPAILTRILYTRQPGFDIGKVLVRLKVTRLTWECNKASFVSPRNCPLFLVEKRAILRQSRVGTLAFFLSRYAVSASEAQ